MFGLWARGLRPSGGWAIAIKNAQKRNDFIAQSLAEQGDLKAKRAHSEFTSVPIAQSEACPKREAAIA